MATSDGKLFVLLLPATQKMCLKPFSNHPPHHIICLPPSSLLCPLKRPSLLWRALIVDNSLFLRKSIRFSLKIAGPRVGLQPVMMFALLHSVVLLNENPSSEKLTEFNLLTFERQAAGLWPSVWICAVTSDVFSYTRTNQCERRGAKLSETGQCCQ